jgi:U2-associated protein SR140
MERKMSWGRLRAEKWKRSVGNILGLWEGWCVFPQESQEHFVKVFNSPPLTEKEEKDAKDREAKEAEKGKSKWKTVEETRRIEKENKFEVDGEPLVEDDVDGQPMDEDVDGEPMEDEDMDGVPMDDDFDGELMDEDGQPMPESSPPADPEPEPKPAPEEPKEVDLGGKKVDASVVRPRQRPKAVDMFADSDDED